MAEDEEPGESAPPRKTDVLFGPGTDWRTEASVNYGPSEVAYQSGFRRAAFHLARHVCETGRGQDFLIYPIVYLYRHHIELALKSIIDIACCLLERELTARELKTLGRHDLAALWQLARPLLNPVAALDDSPGLPADDLDDIDSYIRQLHAHDPDGQRFRYATTAKRGPSLRPDLQHINILDFANALERLADYLDAIETWFDHVAEQAAEMRAEEASGLW
nr:hypothetical protein [uncultured Rhodopila sp.]